MSNLGLPVSDIVNVQVVMSPVAAQTRNFGSLLILGDSHVIDVVERLRLYTTLAAVADDFGTTAPEYKAANLYFAQAPQPTTLYIGRWASMASSGILHGGILNPTQQNIANFTAVTAGKLNISIDGVAKTLTGINLSAVVDLNGVAAAITAALGASATCVWNAAYDRFEITSATTGTTSIVSFATAPSSGTDVGALLLLESGEGGSLVAGIAAETLLTAVSEFDDLSNNWYGLMVAASATVSSSDYLGAAGYIEGANTSRIFGVTTQDTAVLSSTSTTDIASQLKALGYKRTFVQYSSSSPYAVASIYGRAFTVDFNGSNTTITLKFKQEPGVAAEYLSASQAAAVKAKNCNVFVAYNNNTYIVQEGVMVNGFFFDEVHGTDWLQNAVQTAIYNLLYTSPTKVPQTDAGVNLIVSVIAQELQQAVTNGLVAPGVWQAPGFGSLNYGDTLSSGFYIYAPPVATQNVADRAARKAPTIQCAIKLAGAIHFVGAIINVNR